MVRLCAVFQCPNSQKSKKDGSTIHAFPSPTYNGSMRNEWLQSIGHNIQSTILNLENYGVCSRHFNEVDYVVGCEYKSAGLLPTSKPSIFTNI